MEEQQGRKPEAVAKRWGDRRWLALLIVLALALRAWQVWHTEVASRDSIGYIRIAWRLEHEDWRKVLPNSPQHPLYPLAVLAASVPVRHYHGGDLAVAMQLSAQLASCVASVLLVVPMFYLGRELFDRRTAFWATMLFQCLPASGRLMADGLSEPLFLLCASTALWSAVRGLRTGSALALAAAGAASGLAYLTRPEGLVVAVAAGGVLLARQLRRPTRGFLLRMGALTAATLLVSGPFMALVGGLTVKHTAREILAPPRTAGGATITPAVRGPVLLAAWDTPRVPSERGGWALRALGAVLVRASFYVFWLPALVGLWWSRRRPGTWVPALAGGLLALVLYRVAQRMGYLSERHVALLLLCGVYWAAAALLRVGRRLTPPRWKRRGLATTGLLLVLSAVPLSRSAAPLHADRGGFRDAGLWLARHASPGAHVEDPYAWAHYYSGRVFAETGAPAPHRRPSDWYVVVEHAGNEHPHLPLVRQALAHARQGRPVRRWAVRRGREMAEVVVYRVPGPR